jgi:hypothetical protein
MKQLFAFCVITSMIFAASVGNANGLELTFPVGGEELIAGTDTLITWTGCDQTDTVRIEYSNDNGYTWNIITEEGTDFAYLWEDIPKEASGDCSIRLVKGKPSVDFTFPIKWERTISQHNAEIPKRLINTNDGNVLIGGETYGTEMNSPYRQDVYVAKLSSQTGDILWEKLLGDGTHNDINVLYETKNSNTIITYDYTVAFDSSHMVVECINRSGQSIWSTTIENCSHKFQSYGVGSTIYENENGVIYLIGDRKKKNNSGISESNFVLLKLSLSDGSILYEKDDYFQDKPFSYVSQSIIMDANGNLFLCGTHMDDNVPSSIEENIAVVKIDSSNGDTIWEKEYGGSEKDNFKKAIITSNNQLLIYSETESSDGPFSESKGGGNLGVIKINPSDGSVLWGKTFGGSYRERAGNMFEASDGSIIFSSSTGSTDQDLERYNGEYGVWIFKLDSANGNMTWDNLIPKPWKSTHAPSSIFEASDNNFIFSGVENTSAVNSNWNLYKISKDDGSILWNTDFGGSKREDKVMSVETLSNDYILFGSTKSADGDVTGWTDVTDFWILCTEEPTVAIVQADTSSSDISIIFPNMPIKSIDMGNCFYTAEKDSIIEVFIKNDSPINLKLKEVTISSGEKDNFEILDNPGSYTLAPDEHKPYKFRFKPDRPGQHIAQVEVENQVERIMVEIKGNGVAPELDSPRFIALPHLICETTTDTTIVFENTGNYPLKIDNYEIVGNKTEYFKILNDKSNITLKPREKTSIGIKFESNIAGFYEIDLVVKTDAHNTEDGKYRVTLQVRKENMSVNIDEDFIDFGVLRRNESKTIKTNIQNNSTQPISWESPVTIGNFTFTITPKETPAKGTSKLGVKFAGSDITNTTFTENYNFVDTCGVNTITVTASIEPNSSAVINLPNIKAKVGDKIEIPIFLSNTEDIEKSALSSINCQFSFNPLILVTENEFTVKDSKGYISLELPFKKGMDTLTKIPFTVALGNDVGTNLDFINVTPVGSNLVLSKQNGYLEVTDICQQGGTRLFHNSEIEQGFKKVTPNPSGNYITMEIGIIEKGYTEVILCDLIGRKLKTIFSEYVERTDTKSIKHDVSDFENGQYMIVFKSPTYVEQKRIIIIK